MKVNKTKVYRRGIDYPAYAPKRFDECKTTMVMTGEELLIWFTEDELKDYPKPNAYSGSLP